MGEYILETENLGISFGGLDAAKEINLSVKKGEIYGLIGPNGAGKTTIFNLLTGVYRPTYGTFRLDGEPLVGLNQTEINRKGIARTFQNIRLFNNLTVIKNVMVGLSALDEYRCGLMQSIFRMPRHYETEGAMRAKAREILEVFGLGECRNQISFALSYGQQRKLEIARAMATSPKVLLLDEPAAGMNPQETAELTATIRLIRDRFGISILLIEHDMSLVSAICENVMVLNFGRQLCKGTVKEVMNDREVIRAYLGDE